tara:strand:+ start:2219 stop:2404 length:186 start_codon:yes stop_codon:yes gene_type:complete
MPAAIAQKRHNRGLSNLAEMACGSLIGNWQLGQRSTFDRSKPASLDCFNDIEKERLLKFPV